MSKPWSKLQREIYKLLDPAVPMQIQCRAYRMPGSQSHNPQIPRYWVTLDQEIIFDYPANATREQKFTMYDHVPQISQTLREYIDTPLAGLLNKEFTADTFKITDLLKAADRRIGKAKLLAWGQGKPESVRKILNKRFVK